MATPSSTRSCPVCFERFASSVDGASFALHVASCASSSSSPPSSPPPRASPSAASSHCPRCLHVYAADARPHEISFHEHECARVNELLDETREEEEADEADEADEAEDDEETDEDVDVLAAYGHTSKRPCPRRVALFPSRCFLCLHSGRGLLRCRGRCARAAHPNCVDHVQTRGGRESRRAVTELQQRTDPWQCAQCRRGLHCCQRCGFLGHDGQGMQQCVVRNCGYYFHAHCRPSAAAAQQHEATQSRHQGFVCPRHTCAACGARETDMRRCKSCALCFHMTHVRCPRESGAGDIAAASESGDGPESTNLFECSRHDGEATTSLTSSLDASNSLRLRLAAGDVVLVLEFNNALLPRSIKTAAPGAANHWGVVVSAEEMEPRGRGNQLLQVRTFADDNVLAVPNQYALRITTASEFSRPVDLICHCLQRHAMVELQLRQMEEQIDDVEAKRILLVSNTAFAARLKALGMTAAQAMSEAEEGLARWRQFQDLAEPRHYDGLGDLAPIYLYIDTRGFHPGKQASRSVNTADFVADAVQDMGGDVPMTDADTDSGGAATNGSTRGSPHLRRPNSAGKSPHEAEVEQPKTDAILFNTRLTRSCRSKQLQTSTQDTVMTDTRTQPENDSQSWSQGSHDVAQSQSTPTTSTHMNNPSSDAVGPDANSSQWMADVIACADTESAKRQKLNSESQDRFHTTVFTPTKSIHKFLPGATLSSASAPATLHISPMASSARTLFSHKRKQLTRKQKLLADMPPLVLEKLEREVLRYLEEADGSKPKLTRISADAEAFPWAARSTRFRPAFYRPSVMLGHCGLRRPGLDAVSCLLVSQDKRSIKCYVQALETNSEVSKCTHLSTTITSASPCFVQLDLLSLRSFRDLESVVRRRVIEALGKRSRYPCEYSGMDAHHARRWLEQQRRKNTCEQPPITLSYCAADGIRRHLNLHEASPKPSPKGMQAWLCFCANVCHISAVVAIQGGAPSTLVPLPTAPQRVSAAQ